MFAIILFFLTCPLINFKTWQWKFLRDTKLVSLIQKWIHSFTCWEPLFKTWFWLWSWWGPLLWFCCRSQSWAPSWWC
jgi:hypothetical protein